jgi:hypothetical protein
MAYSLGMGPSDVGSEQVGGGGSFVRYCPGFSVVDAIARYSACR